MDKTVFNISRMDCPSEETLIRMKLEGLQAIRQLDFDLPGRQLSVYHEGRLNDIETAIHELNLNAKRLKTEKTDPHAAVEQTTQRKLLWSVLFINFGFFLIEITTGFISQSMGLVADSLDMLADSIVYGLSLFAVGGTVLLKKRIATISGCFQLLLAGLGFMEVIRRFLGIERVPDFKTMIIVSGLALLGNATCLYLLQRSKSHEAHMKASMIFTSNDVIINMGVIAAAIGVHWLDSNKPDLIIGAVVFLLVIYGAFRILKLGR
ncbi:MAG: cation transporter [Deltaproteobacteria bacterium]|nr:cation transporter [Deltaproteobacteria bacterium]